MSQITAKVPITNSGGGPITNTGGVRKNSSGRAIGGQTESLCVVALNNIAGVQG
jgi:hypothetical protein